MEQHTFQPISEQEFAKRVYAIVDEIPRGKVASYGQLAMLAGYPQYSRRAGKVMSQAPRDCTSHRVVNSSGRLVSGWPEQRRLLLEEGVCFKENGCVNMKAHRWQPFL